MKAAMPSWPSSEVKRWADSAVICRSPSSNDTRGRSLTSRFVMASASGPPLSSMPA